MLVAGRIPGIERRAVRYAGAVVAAAGHASVAPGELPEIAPSRDVELLIAADALPGHEGGRP
jgi:hypothetical protein